MISASDVGRLSTSYQVAFAARCARRAVPVFLDWARQDNAIDRAQTIESALVVAEDGRARAMTDVDAAQPAINALRDVTPRFFSKPARLAAQSVEYAVKADLERALRDFSYRMWDEATAQHCAKEVARCSLKAAECAVAAVKDPNARRNIEEGIGRDLQLLQTFQRDPLVHGTAGVRTAFATNLAFSIQAPDKDRTIVQIAKQVDRRLVDHFRRDPARLHGMDPREFEELVAGFFDTFGFRVNLTQRTRDGGYDILAIGDARRKYSYLIECKRYAPEHKVGVGIVRQLAGVVLDSNLNSEMDRVPIYGLIVTTSHFTPEANKFLRRNRWLLAGQDFDSLVSWLETHEKVALAREIGMEHAVIPWL